MPEKLTSIYTLPPFNSNTSPIIIQNGELLKNNENGKIFVRLGLENLSGKEIECIFVCIDSFDSDGKLLETINEYRYFGSKMQIFLNDNSATSFQTVIRKVIFSDKSMLNLSDEDFESVCGQEPLSDSLQADEKTAGNEKKRIRILKKFLLAELIAIAVLTLSAVIIFKQGYNIFKYAYENGDYSLASKVYAWKTNSEDTMDAINDILQPEADKAYDDYNKSKIEYDDAKEIIERINEVSNNHFEDYNTKIDKLKSSKENFEKGKQLEQSNDYENALMAYQMVVADDTNYSDAQGGISRIKEKVHNDIIAQADKYVSNGNYKEGREYVAKNNGILSADEQSKYKEKFDTQEKAEKERKERAMSDSTMISKVIADYKRRLHYPDKCTIHSTQIENIESKEDKLNGIVRRRVYIKATVLGQPMKEDENGNLVEDYEKGGHYSDVNEVAQISYNKNTGKYTINIDGWN